MKTFNEYLEMAVKESETPWTEKASDIASELAAEINKKIDLESWRKAMVSKRMDTSTGEVFGDANAENKIKISQIVKDFDARKKNINIDLQWNQKEKDGYWEYRAFIKIKKSQK